jgi:hypothetical protein
MLLAVILSGGTPNLAYHPAAAVTAGLPNQGGAAPLYGVPSNGDGTERAGGRAVAYHPGGRLIQSASVLAQAPSARLFFNGYGGWEPSLGLDRQGTILYAAENSNSDAEFIRSRDGGRTWSPVNPPGDRITLDPYMYTDPQTGRVFYTNQVPLSCPKVWFSDDQGDTWTPSAICGEFDNQVIYGGPAPAAGPKPAGYPNVTYYCAIEAVATASASTSTECSKSLNGGLVWTPTGQPAYPPQPHPSPSDPSFPFCNGAVGHHGAVGPDGTVYQPRMWCGHPYVAISHDEGSTWTRVQIAPGAALLAQDGTPTAQASAAVDTAGNVYFSWVGANHHPYMAVSRTGGRTWSTPIDLLPPGVRQVSGFNTSIVAGGRGRVAMLYMGSKQSPTTPAAATTWNGYVIETSGALDTDPVLYAASVNNPTTTPLNRGACGDVRCNVAGDFMDLVIGPDGAPWASLVDQCPPGYPCPINATTQVITPRGEAVLGHLVGGPDLRAGGSNSASARAVRHP